MEKSDDSFDRFRYLLASEFDLEGSIVDQSSAIIWAILKGYNPDRYHHLKAGRHPRRRSVKSQVKVGQMVKLAGFRTVH
jgi:hypothetical protein